MRELNDIVRQVAGLALNVSPRVGVCLYVAGVMLLAYAIDKKYETTEKDGRLFSFRFSCGQATPFWRQEQMYRSHRHRRFPKPEHYWGDRWNYEREALPGIAEEPDNQQEVTPR
ncbi:MAG: hypothetical protein P1U63_10400 [Coxiellaceae bacterium]|nr:hypothetical protein [Coxiellaceae bacterium]